jgi:hypothetical protein
LDNPYDGNTLAGLDAGDVDYYQLTRQSSMSSPQGAVAESPLYVVICFLFI